MKQCNAILSLIFCVLTSSAFADTRDQQLLQAGTPCDTEQQLSSLLAEHPLICMLGVWRPVRVVPEDNGELRSLTYRGECKLSLERDSKSRVRLKVLKGEMFDICLPPGDRIGAVAMGKSGSWKVAKPALFKNVLLLEGLDSSKTSLWIYSKTDTDHSRKYEIVLESE